jgi:hypothetical protein
MVDWQTFWFERALALQRRLPAPVALGADPIFIMGLWRSGTTLLHGLLGALGTVHYPATWQCMNASAFRLRRPPQSGKTARRPMDDVSVDAFSPQEDEFALLTLGVPSVYRGFFDPRRLDELAQWLEPEAWTADRPAGWLERWLEFLAGVSGNAAPAPGRLLLKSPNHVFRIRALQQAFPNAAYIWLVRDPTDIFVSNRRMWTAMFERYALWHWEQRRLDHFLKRAFECATRCITEAVRDIPADRLVVVEFNHLTASPQDVARHIGRRLGIGDEVGVEPDRTAAVAERITKLRPEPADATAPPEIAAALAAFADAQRAACTTHGLARSGGPP